MSRDNGKAGRVPRKVYEAELGRMQLELARMQYWLRDEGARPEADVLDKIAASEVVAAVDKLPPLHREVVLLVDVEGFSYKDAAQTLGVPIGTVMSRLHRARQQLQRSLYDYAVESGIVRPSGMEQVPQQ